MGGCHAECQKVAPRKQIPDGSCCESSGDFQKYEVPELFKCWYTPKIILKLYKDVNGSSCADWWQDVAPKLLVLLIFCLIKYAGRHKVTFFDLLIVASLVLK